MHVNRPLYVRYKNERITCGEFAMTMVKIIRLDAICKLIKDSDVTVPKPRDHRCDIDLLARPAF